MHTVIETPGYLRKAKSLMSDAQREAVVTMIAADPSAGDVMTGTGGFRKIRFALEGRGKSGGARVIYYYCDAGIPVFLVQIYAKNEKANVSGSEKIALTKMAEEIKRNYGR